MTVGRKIALKTLRLVYPRVQAFGAVICSSKLHARSQVPAQAANVMLRGRGPSALQQLTARASVYKCPKWSYPNYNPSDNRLTKYPGPPSSFLLCGSDAWVFAVGVNCFRLAVGENYVPKP